MGLVAEDDDVVVDVNGLDSGVVEFLDEREHEARVAFQALREVGPAFRDVGRSVGGGHAAAAREGGGYLLIQLFAVGHHQEGRRPRELALNLTRKEHHRVALARALRMPEHTELALADVAIHV